MTSSFFSLSAFDLFEEDLREEEDVEAAIGAMTRAELRELVRAARAGSPFEWSLQFTDLVLRHGAYGQARWRPSPPNPDIIARVRAALSALPTELSERMDHMDACLRQGMRAFRVKDFRTAREIFEAVLDELSGWEPEPDPDLQPMPTGRLVDVHHCAGEYLVSVFETTPPEQRPHALIEAAERVQPLCNLTNPLYAMEMAAGRPLTDLPEMIPPYARVLEKQLSRWGTWLTRRDHFLLEAVERLEGMGGVERIARKTAVPEALLRWVDSSILQFEWSNVLYAAEEAAALAADPRWKAVFLERAAQASSFLDEEQSEDRYMEAWKAAPHLPRLVRMLAHGNAEPLAIFHRAERALESCPAEARDQRGLLCLLTGDTDAVVELLTRAPADGWEERDHPVHLLFPAAAAVVAGPGEESTLRRTLFLGPLEMSMPFSLRYEGRAEDGAPPDYGSTPPVPDLIYSAAALQEVGAEEKARLFEAMLGITDRRVDALLAGGDAGTGEEVEQNMHLAILIGACVEMAREIGQTAETGEWRSTIEERCAAQGERGQAIIEAMRFTLNAQPHLGSG